MSVPSTSVGTLLPQWLFPRVLTRCTWPIRWAVRRFAMVVCHYARWTRKPDRIDAERVERSLAAAGLLPPKMPEICQKMVDSGLSTGHSGQAQVRGIAREIGNAERWPSGRRHQIANLASWVTGTEGSNPSLSAKLQYFLASNVMV